MLLSEGKAFQEGGTSQVEDAESDSGEAPSPKGPWCGHRGREEIMYLMTGCLQNSKVKNQIWEAQREWKEANSTAVWTDFPVRGAKTWVRSWERCGVRGSFNTVDVSACFTVDGKVPREGKEWWKRSWESRIGWNSDLKCSGLLKMRAGALLSYQQKGSYGSKYRYWGR